MPCGAARWCALSPADESGEASGKRRPRLRRRAGTDGRRLCARTLPTLFGALSIASDRRPHLVDLALLLHARRGSPPASSSLSGPCGAPGVLTRAATTRATRGGTPAQ